MKMRNWVIGLIILFSAASCLDTTEETTVNEDGSGLYVNTADMGQIFGMLKNMGGGGDDMKGIDKVKMDTVIYFKELKDSMTTLSEDEKKIIEAGNMRIVMKTKNLILRFQYLLLKLKKWDLSISYLLSQEWVSWKIR
jgi:hypothetical protein